MADLAYRNQGINLNYRRTDWGAIWGGVFTFMAIWSVFGALGLAIFSGAVNPNATAPVLGMSVGMGIWAIVLTIIAMYVAGRETGHLAGVANRHDGLIHGMIMFGLSAVSAMILVVLGGTSLSVGTGVVGTAHSPYVLTMFVNLGWIGFVALFLGWIAAMVGASSGVGQKVESNVHEIRPAA